MKGLENPTYLLLLIISNVAALLMIVLAVKWPRISRMVLATLFGWACYINWKTSQLTPQVYLEYGNLAWTPFYREFINGWFAGNIKLAVGGIATCQGLIALGLLAGGRLLKIAGTGAILFLLAIIPLGVGSGFPATLLMAIAMLVTLRKAKTPLISKRLQPVAPN
ncbi:hypothetical protein [Foetidibacter luteolus]|uniref:hypothetical protein n=1 Tax=Foetidibacter luteolus TaxID=2608880 RepID=UPI00129A24DC|nr:hypothetical protein [Foetidibacter luteolus]